VTGDVQLFAYPEELAAASPGELASLVRDLGCDAVALALVYHRARRVFPRQRRVGVLGRSTAYFRPTRERYAEVRPLTTDLEFSDRIGQLRDACESVGVGFRAWIVALHDEQLAAEHPSSAGRMIDGAPNGIGLCPSARGSIEYVDALVRDICAQFRPDSVELEAALYPAWEPAYTLTLTLDAPSATAASAAMQCFCPACRQLMGGDADELQRRTAAGEFPTELFDARVEGVRRLIESAAETAHAGGSKLRVLASGPPGQVALQGLASGSVECADRVLIGCGALAGDELADRFEGLRALIDGRAATPSLNWTPERSGGALARDAAAMAGAGADGLALYNLTLLPDDALADISHAAAAFRGAP
jgi:hypothetical protein